MHPSVEMAHLLLLDFRILLPSRLLLQLSLLPSHPTDLSTVECLGAQSLDDFFSVSPPSGLTPSLWCYVLMSGCISISSLDFSWILGQHSQCLLPDGK
jgi:hypothetical protein